MVRSCGMLFVAVVFLPPRQIIAFECRKPRSLLMRLFLELFVRRILPVRKLLTHPNLRISIMRVLRRCKRPVSGSDRCQLDIGVQEVSRNKDRNLRIGCQAVETTARCLEIDASNAISETAKPAAAAPAKKREKQDSDVIPYSRSPKRVKHDALSGLPSTMAFDATTEAVLSECKDSFEDTDVTEIDDRDDERAFGDPEDYFAEL
ncbi:uncharacterized protein MYCGRDRAFT_97752 [Zymoseptoria tritici IPO323]|uniref:Uncharacterized protein n=1 Tax=Zymoseptoria tritici (strain CBS 115943 / IPO323) TaxID=336722 RepID=F9XR93_ZYMTI|nr:uncharacterized protein MYCGRDRAFT_97752 [Zymoseptoria tritici IPO323]EGP82251.1 hypothetical protein MYCGRDRAFT_97752 [Zymoseptoria tritici IPO323]